jgi:translocation protein SEC72
MSLTYDSVTKKVTAVEDNEKYLEEVDALNRLASDLISSGLDVPENGEPDKNMTSKIQGLVNSAMESMKKRNFSFAIVNITAAIGMASKRKRWESFQIQMQEMVGFLQLRTDAYMMSGKYAEALADADLLIGITALSADNFLRKAVSLVNLKRPEEAKVVLERGLSLHEDHPGLLKYLDLSNKMIASENGEW